jgi:ubiquinone/menaquinone biosynthesis C-methylase UbiE
VDSKQSEKEYLRRTSAGEWERLKPFSPPGTDTVADSAALIQDFAAAIAHLPPKPTDLILDIGAGACWCSDWLQRLNLQTVAVDISWDMLRLGRTRFRDPAAAFFVTGDLEYLPFASASFDKAYCLSAIHHVPSIRRAVVEIHRVLKPEGAAVFSEPGVGHADKPGSISAMRDFGVLEQDIVISEFMDACHAAGFADVRLKPLSYTLPAIDLTAAQWDAWRRLARTKRPRRAGRKLWRALLELAGVGKQDELIEETLAMMLVRVLRSAMEDHPVVVASRSPLPAVAATRPYSADVELLAAPGMVLPGAPVALRIRIKNTGGLSWETAERAGGGQVRIGVQLMDANQRLVDREFHRASLPSPLPPGAQAECELTCSAPSAPGTYHLKIDLVAEGVTWFEPVGSRAVMQRFVVTTAASSARR